MSIIACPKCHRQYQIKGDPTGKSVKCANCQHVFAVNAPMVAQQVQAQQVQQPSAGATGQLTSQPGLFPDPSPVPAGPDPLANHIVQDPGFADVDIDEIRRNRETAARKNNKLANAFAASSSLAKMDEEEQQRERSRVRNEGYLSSETLFGFDGRINRKKFWLSSILFGFILAAIMSVLIFGYVAIQVFVLGNKAPSPSASNALMDLLPIFFVMFIVGAVGTWTSFALHIKRYHDLGYPGARLWLWLIPVVGGIWVIVECGFFPGQPGRNEYGADPLE